MAKRETLWFRLEYAAYRCNVFDTYLYVGTAHMAERYVEGFFFLVFFEFFSACYDSETKSGYKAATGI